MESIDGERQKNLDTISSLATMTPPHRVPGRRIVSMTNPIPPDRTPATPIRERASMTSPAGVTRETALAEIRVETPGVMIQVAGISKSDAT